MDISSTRYAALVALVFMAGCGGGGGNSDVAPPPPPPPANTLSTNQTLPGFPHQIDIYAPAGATRVIVFLHGALATKSGFAYQLGLNEANANPTDGSVNWTWLQANKVVAVFPQGQAIPADDKAYSWTNHEMTSGQDDVAFLQALSAYARTKYGTSRVYVVGHSSGAMMANRMWCESPTTFDGYVALSGPASAFYLNPQGNSTCRPSTYQPYYGLIGSDDNVLQTQNWTADTWTVNPLLLGGPALVNPVLIGEWSQYLDRAKIICNATPQLGDAVVSGNTQTWNTCGGKLQAQLEAGYPHGLSMPDDPSSPNLVNRAIAFINKAAP